MPEGQPQHIELGPETEELLGTLAPDKGVFVELDDIEAGGDSPVEQRRRALSLESKALYNNVHKIRKEIGQRTLRLAGTPLLVNLVDQTNSAWDSFREASMDYGAGKIDEEDLRVAMFSSFKKLESIRDQLPSEK